MKRILVVEDAVTLLQTICDYLRASGFDPVSAIDGAAGLQLFLSDHIDLALVDLNLPKINGQELIKTIRERNPNIPILIITAFADIESKLEAFELGADDYLVKPFHLPELEAKIKVFLKRSEQTQGSGEYHKVAGLEVWLAEKKVCRDGREINLTSKEFGLLEYLITKEGRVATKTELTDALWNDRYGATPNTVEVYINFLRNKIDKGFQPKLIHTKVGFGYYLKDKQE